MKTKGNADKIGPWTREENDIITAAYIAMWQRELNDEKNNKAQMRRDGLAAMATYREDRRERSHGSWEMKCCNISAALKDQGMQWINGYKPLKGYQHALKPAIVEAIKQADLFFDEERYFLKPQEART